MFVSRTDFVTLNFLRDSVVEVYGASVKLGLHVYVLCTNIPFQWLKSDESFRYDTHGSIYMDLDSESTELSIYL